MTQDFLGKLVLPMLYNQKYVLGFDVSVLQVNFKRFHLHNQFQPVTEGDATEYVNLVLRA